MEITRTARVGLQPNGLVVVRINEGAYQSLSDAKENLAAALAARAGLRRPLLVDIRGAMPLDAEARHHYSGQTLVDGFAAMAMVIDTRPLGRMMGNVYLRIARPGIPTQLFAEEPQAVAWLEGFRA